MDMVEVKEEMVGVFPFSPCSRSQRACRSALNSSGSGQGFSEVSRWPSAWLKAQHFSKIWPFLPHLVHESVRAGIGFTGGVVGFVGEGAGALLPSFPPFTFPVFPFFPLSAEISPELIFLINADHVSWSLLQEWSHDDLSASHFEQAGSGTAILRCGCGHWVCTCHQSKKTNSRFVFFVTSFIRLTI